MFAGRRNFALLLILGLTGVSTVAVTQSSSPRPNPPAVGPYRIAGTVVNALSGSPLARTRVTILDAHDPKNLQWTISSDDGRFEFKQLPQGKYGLQGRKRGFIAAAYEEHEQFSTAIVTGAGLDTEHLVLRLPPVAKLYGKVVNEGGEPVRHASVSLYTEDRRVGVGRIQKIRQESTDDQGYYEFASLDPGTYFVSVTATPWYALHPSSFRGQNGENPPSAVEQSLDVAYPVTYYKGATEPDEASPIPIRAGDHVEIELPLSPVPALHLLLHLPDNGGHVYSVPTLEKPSFDGVDYVPVASSAPVSPGIIEIDGVAPGRYTVRMPTSTPGVQAGEVEMDLSADGQELDPTKGEPAGDVKASVKVMGEEAIPQQLAFALRNSKLRVVAWQRVGEKGNLEFKDITPGRYELLPQAPGKRYSVLRIGAGGHETSGHFLTVSAGTLREISVTLVGSALNVEGYAKRGGQAAPGAMVVLVPRNPEANRELFRRDQSDLDGSFTLAGVIPGAYTVCAIEDGWDLDWSKSAVIAHYCEHGRRIDVSERKDGVLKLGEAVEVQAK